MVMFLYQKMNYEVTVLSSNSNLDEIAEKFSKSKPDYMVFDTETTGLNFIKDKPFLIGFGFDKQIYIFEPNIMSTKLMYDLASKTKYFFAHNAKYDYDMMQNLGDKIPENVPLADSMTVARLTEYADSDDGIGLEVLGQKYVDETSKFAGKVIRQKVNEIRKERMNLVKKFLKNVFTEKNSKSRIESVTATYSNLLRVGFDTGFYKKFLKMDFERKMGELENLDVVEYLMDEIDKVYQEPTYEDVYKREPELMISYLADDLVIMLEYLNKAYPVLAKVDPDGRVMQQEMQLIPVVSRMQRVGLRADIDYLLESRIKVDKYRQVLYRHLRRLTGMSFTSGQHQVIKDYFLNKHGIYLPSADVKQLTNLTKSTSKHVRKVAETIVELRTLDKWLSTYIEGMLGRIQNGRIYTSINNAGTVTGRVSSDMQQQPKEPLSTRGGRELFHPRKVFITDPNTKIYYFDFNAMELRVQAHYTLKVSDGDYNLCNAFIPFKHISMFTGEMFDYSKHDWDSGEWVDEQGNLWTPTDPHTETTLKAFPEITKDHPQWKHYRSLGKRANFLKNYGGGYAAIMEQMDLDEQVARKLDVAYYKAFPKVLDYQRWVTRQLTKYGYIENIFGRRYYFSNASRFYRGFNYLIQGGCADLMKRKEIQIDELLKNYKSKLVMVVHDEAQVIVHEDEEQVLVPLLRNIMNNNPEIDTLPMTAGIEVTTTNWAEKEEIE